jgi:hypothetical protein
MATGLIGLPRTMNARQVFRTTKYDPAVGWFSGGASDVTVAPGNIFATRYGYIALDDPVLQVGAPGLPANGGRFSQTVLDLGAAGPTSSMDRYFYNVGVRVSHRIQRTASVGDADSSALRALNLSPSALQQVTQFATRLGIPVGGALSSSKDRITFVARIDRAPFDWAKLVAAERTFGFLVFAEWAEQSGVGRDIANFSSRGSKLSHILGGVGLTWSGLWRDRLIDVRSTFSMSHDAVTPMTPGPSAIIEVAAADSGFGTALIGGDATTRGSERWTWENKATLERLARRHGWHQMKLAADVRIDGARQSSSLDAGQYTYALSAATTDVYPVSFLRRAQDPDASVSVVNGFVSVGDQWRPTPYLRIDGGVRLEANRFLGGSGNRPDGEVFETPSIATGPASIALIPRLGLGWNVNAPSGGPRTVDDFLQWLVSAPIRVRAGIGAYRGFVGPDQWLSVAATGARSATRDIICVGSSVPAPSWTSGGAVTNPQACRDSGASGLASLPVTNRRAADWGPPISWRSTVGWSSAVGALSYSVDATWSVTRHQSSMVDENLARTPAFVTTDEHRPIFVPVAAIDVLTGALSIAESRTNKSLGVETVLLSDAWSRARDVTISLAPVSESVSGWIPRLIYSWGDVRAANRELTTTTFANPRDFSSEPGRDDIRHSVQLQVTRRIGEVVIAAFARWTSGAPFTPIVDRDVNGDGRINDRAYLYDLAPNGNASLGRALALLLPTLPHNVQSCLSRQMGYAASPNSCRGPWTSEFTLRASIPGVAIRLPGRVTAITLYVNNSLGGLDELFHGTRDLRGWGAPTGVDAVLWQVRGFDAGTKQFRYSINPNFGRTRASEILLRRPTQLTLEASIDIGRPIGELQAERYLKIGRRGYPGKPLTVQDYRSRYAAVIRNPADAILAESDSLLLTDRQIQSLQSLQSGIGAHLDSAWTALAEFMVAQGENYSVPIATKRQEATIGEVRDWLRLTLRTALPAVLTRAQLGLLPGDAFDLYWNSRSRSPSGRTLRP